MTKRANRMEYLSKPQRDMFDQGVEINCLNQISITINDQFSNQIAKATSNAFDLPFKYVGFEKDKYSRYPKFKDMGKEEVPGSFETFKIEMCGDRVLCTFSPYIWNLNSVVKIIDWLVSESSIELVSAQRTLNYNEKNAKITNIDTDKKQKSHSPKTYKNASKECYYTHSCAVDCKDDFKNKLSDFSELSSISSGKDIWAIDVADDFAEVVGNPEYLCLTSDFSSFPSDFDNLISSCYKPDGKCTLLLIDVRQSEVIVSIDYVKLSHFYGAGVLYIISGVGSCPKVNAFYSSRFFTEVEASNHFHELIGKPERNLISAAPEKVPNLDFSIREKLISSFLRNTNKVALTYDNKSYTYAQLEDLAEQIAREYLTGLDPVIIISEPSIEYVAMVIACISRAVPFIPIDPNYGLNRVHQALEITRIQCTFLGKNSTENFIDIESYIRVCAESFPQKNLKIKVQTQVGAEQPIYCMFTSGTTGASKAVLINERNLAAFFSSYDVIAEGIYEMRWPFISSISFDASIKQYLGPILFGGEIYIPNTSFTKDPLSVLHELSEKVNILNCTPSLLSTILKTKINLSSFKYVFVGGEALDQALIDKFLERATGNANLINLYGPTETTINASYYLIDQSIAYDIVPIGSGLKYSDCEILQNGSLANTSVPGELIVMGDIVGKYHNLESDNFFTFQNRKAYKTGDICFKWFDGLFYYKGRNDDQLKINGIRFDISELVDFFEMKFRDDQFYCFDDKGAIYVAFVEDNADRQSFVRHVVKSAGIAVTPTMIFLPSLPVTPSGKMDKQSILEMHNSIHDSRNIQVETFLETEITKIINSILLRQNLQPIRVCNDILSVGLDSLALMELVIEIEGKYGISILPQEVLEYRSIKELANKIEEDSEANLCRVYGDINSKKVLILLPPVLGKGIIFHDFIIQAKKEFLVVTLDYPSKGQSVESIQDIVDIMLEGIAETISDKEIHVMGYSMGASVGYELIRAIEKQRSAEIERFVILDKEPTVSMNYMQQLEQNIEFLNEFIGSIKVSKVLQESLTEALEKNTRIGYEYQPSGKIHCNTTYVTCTRGQKLDLTKWDQLICGVINTREIDCSHNHVFSDEQLPYLLGIINSLSHQHREVELELLDN